MIGSCVYVCVCVLAAILACGDYEPSYLQQISFLAYDHQRHNRREKGGRRNGVMESNSSPQGVCVLARHVRVRPWLMMGLALLGMLLVGVYPRLGLQPHHSRSSDNTDGVHSMPIDRSLGRNVHFYDASKPGVALGGLIQNGSVTESNFLEMLWVLLITEAPLRVQERASGHVVTITNNPLQPGEYDFYCESPIEVSNEPWAHRLISHNVSGREDAFRDGIRSRDGKCVISGLVNSRAYRGNWTLFEATHIFPLQQESLWIQFNYGRWITDMDNTDAVSKINSLQNGFILREDIHSLFDQYLISVNPDDNYKIVVFDDDILGLDGRILDPVCRDPANPHCVADQLLRWHFRQSVLANMRGAGEPIFEHDFPPGTDMMGEIREGPYAQERLEMEFESRLRGIV